jgi:uncharacterized protein YegP (UPF0339 family)
MHCDIFYFNGKAFLTLVDNFSGLLSCFPIKDETTDTVTSVLFKRFLQSGFPLYLRSDNGGQFREKFKNWCSNHGIVHQTSSPYNHEKHAEKAVCSAKQIVKKSSSITQLQEELFAFNLTPRQTGYSPSELFYGRSLRDYRLPVHKKTVNCKLNNLQENGAAAMQKALDVSKDSAGGHALPPLPVGSRVLLQDPVSKAWNSRGVIIAARDGGRSYYVEIDKKCKQFLRNRRFLRPIAGSSPSTTMENSESSASKQPVSKPPILRRSLRLQNQREPDPKQARVSPKQVRFSPREPADIKRGSPHF